MVLRQISGERPERAGATSSVLDTRSDVEDSVAESSRAVLAENAAREEVGRSLAQENSLWSQISLAYDPRRLAVT